MNFEAFWYSRTFYQFLTLTLLEGICQSFLGWVIFHGRFYSQQVQKFSTSSFKISNPDSVGVKNRAQKLSRPIGVERDQDKNSREIFSHFRAPLWDTLTPTLSACEEPFK